MHRPWSLRLWQVQSAGGPHTLPAGSARPGWQCLEGLQSIAVSPYQHCRGPAHDRPHGHRLYRSDYTLAATHALNSSVCPGYKSCIQSHFYVVWRLAVTSSCRPGASLLPSYTSASCIGSHCHEEAHHSSLPQAGNAAMMCTVVIFVTVTLSTWSAIASGASCLLGCSEPMVGHLPPPSSLHPLPFATPSPPLSG